MAVLTVYFDEQDFIVFSATNLLGNSSKHFPRIDYLVPNLDPDTTDAIAASQISLSLSLSVADDTTLSPLGYNSVGMLNSCLLLMHLSLCSGTEPQTKTPKSQTRDLRRVTLPDDRPLLRRLHDPRALGISLPGKS